MIKLYHSDYDEYYGFSCAAIKTDLGIFTGTSILHDEDKDIASKYAGCEYAEIRAIIKYIKAKIQILKYQLIGIENCEKAMKNKKDYNHNSSEARTLRKQKYILEKEIKTWKERAESLHQKNYDKMMNRRKILDEIDKKAKGDGKKC